MFVPGVEALCEAGGHGADEHEGRLAAGLAPAHQLKKTMMMFALFMFLQLGLELGHVGISLNLECDKFLLRYSMLT